MKILCELLSRETHTRLTSTEIEADRFGLSLDNPFPASEIMTASFNEKSAIVTYQVAKAWGEA
jgi:hypothetical protein